MNNSNESVRKIINEKGTKICLAADVSSVDELLKIADEMGPYICILKIHYDIIPNFHESNCGIELVKIKERHNFLVWEDRKFADIGSIMERQIRTSVLPWADIVSAHPLPGLESLRAIPKEVGIILIGELSCYGNLIDRNYTKRVVELSESLSNLVGFVGQRDIRTNNGPLMFVPGISLEENNEGDGKGQRYSTIQSKSFADVFVIGRGILNTSNPLETIKKFINYL